MKRLLGWALALVAAAFLIATVDLDHVGSTALSPRLEPGDVVVVDRVSYLVRLPYRGDIVCLGPAEFRRVVGIAGDVVKEGKSVRVPGGFVLAGGAGLVPLEQIHGRAVFLAWPLHRRGILP